MMNGDDGRECMAGWNGEMLSSCRAGPAGELELIEK